MTRVGFQSALGRAIALRYEAVLVATVALFVSQSLSGPNPAVRVLALNALLLATWLASRPALGRVRRGEALLLGASLPALAATSIASFRGEAWLLALGLLGYLACFGLAAAAVLREVLRATHITSSTLAAALWVYLLLGLCFAFLYAQLELITPGAFSASGAQGAAAPRVLAVGEKFYFSLVTLSTLGYGDIVPRSSVARSLASVEALAGQIYLAVLIASLVGGHRGAATRGER